MASFNILLLSQVLSLKDAKGATGYKEAAPGRERTSADAAEPRNRSFPRPLGEPTYNGRAETPPCCTNTHGAESARAGGDRVAQDGARVRARV